MSCLMPLFAVKIRDQVKVVKRADLLNKLEPFVDTYTGEYVEPFEVPCGKCLGCRLDYARTWSNRCMLESQVASDNWFITLTYDDENLVFGDHGFATLEPKHFTDFMKRLRKHYADRGHENVRFYMAGEYGDSTYRPHYHMLAFNLPILDLQFYSRSPLGDCYYNSPLLTEKWGHGHVVIGELTYQSAAYTARYCMKKVDKSIDYDAIGVHKEYVRMSRRPGIGYGFLLNNLEEVYSDGKIYLPDGKMCSPFRYFDLKAEELGINVQKEKERRLQAMQLKTEQQQKMLSYDEWQRFEDMEKALTQKSRALRRNLC